LKIKIISAQEGCTQAQADDYSCPICKKDLSNSNFKERVNHLKSCAKKFKTAENTGITIVIGKPQEKGRASKKGKKKGKKRKDEETDFKKQVITSKFFEMQPTKKIKHVTAPQSQFIQQVQTEKEKSVHSEEFAQLLCKFKRSSQPTTKTSLSKKVWMSAGSC
jgi:hypothetical protein